MDLDVDANVNGLFGPLAARHPRPYDDPGMRAAPLALVFGAALGCGVEDDLGPQTVRLIARDDSGEYGLRDERLETLESARQVRGQASKVRGGGILLIEETLLKGDLSVETSDDVQQSALVDGHRPVEADYTKAGELLVPRDWESLLMFSFYRHVERGLDYYEDLGVGPAERQTFLAHFNIRFTLLLAWGTTLIADNAAYAPLEDALLLFPRRSLDEGVPLMANEGVIAHELSHGIKHRIVSPGDLPLYAEDSWDDRAAINSYRADDEGLADFFAAVMTGDSDFIAPSLVGVDIDRDLSRTRPFTLEMYEDLSDSVAVYNPYELGSALASFLWATAADDPQSRLLLARTVVRTLYEVGPHEDESYRVPFLIDAIMARAPDALRQRGCELLDELLEGPFREVPTCGL